jgi:butyrate kinase
MGSNKTVYTILVINPGSTTTKLALYRNDTERHAHIITHPARELRQYPTVAAQTGFRLLLAQRFLQQHLQKKLHAIAARGGLLRPVPSGVYRVTVPMCTDLRAATYGEHASNLGALIGSSLGEMHQCDAFIADPVVVDEMDPVARISGMPAIERRSIFHALNQKASAREVAGKLGKKYENCNLIVAHLGGGISVGAHLEGKVVDVNNALGGDGPFSPERSGGLPSLQLATLVGDNRESFQNIKNQIVGNGGLIAYCGTNDLQELMRKIGRGDTVAALVFQALIYQISKEIAMHGATLRGKVDAIVLTGGMAHNSELITALRERVSFLAPIHVVPGEREMAALAGNILAVLRNEREILEY